MEWDRYVETSVEVGSTDTSVGEGSAGVSVGMGSGETSVGREGIASEGLTAMGEATSEGKENGKAVELKVGKGQAVRFPESGRGALGVLEEVGVVPLNPEGGGGWHQSWEMGE